MTLNNINQYGPGFQTKVIASLLNHKDFLINIHDIISEEYFESQAHKWLIKEILKYYDKYHTTPSLEVLKVEYKKVQNEVLQIAIKEQPQVIDAITQHGQAIRAKAEGKAGVLFRVDPGDAQHVRMHHAAAGNLEPTALKGAGHESDIELGRGLGEGEERGTETHF